jgi:1-acyl-sn-glycerol-3-phosphate acyltransferase
MIGIQILSFHPETYFWPAKTFGMIIFRRIYTIYASVVFTITFLIAFPFFFIFAQNKKWHKSAYLLTHFWGRVFLVLTGIKLHIDNRNTNDWSEPCVYVANHFSYADIASIPMLTRSACFVGKQSIQKVPLFGYYFRSLHISLNRESARDRAHVLKRGMDALEDGKSLIIFPEGGIRTKNPPQQVPYKDGAFIMALRKGVPVVPITLPTNHKLLPDDGKLLLRSNKVNIVVHEAIDCSGMDESNLKELKEQVYDTIQNELNNWNGVRNED